MPYIPSHRREALTAGKILQLPTEPARPGELNFLITKMCLRYLRGGLEPHTYTDLNTIIGVLECVKLEFYRRVVICYEDEKIKEHGDVY